MEKTIDFFHAYCVVTQCSFPQVISEGDQSNWTHQTFYLGTDAIDTVSLLFDKTVVSPACIRNLTLTVCYRGSFTRFELIDLNLFNDISKTTDIGIV